MTAAGDRVDSESENQGSLILKVLQYTKCRTWRTLISRVPPELRIPATSAKAPHTASNVLVR